MNGFSSPLLTLPPEVFVKICLHLDPCGLISITRTCQSLRKTLLARSAGHIWRAVRLNESPVLMERPQDMSEAAWTALIYDKRCHACGNIGLTVLWALHLRLCADCTKICKDRHVSLGGRVEAFDALYHVGGARTIRANRVKFRESFISGIRSVHESSAPDDRLSRSNSTRRSAPALRSVDALVADLYTTFLRCYFPPRVDVLGRTPSYLIPGPSDIQPALEAAVATPNPPAFWQFPYLMEGLHLASMVESWTRFIEREMLQLLPERNRAERGLALSVWRAARSPRVGPAWWPCAAHLYLALSESVTGPRKSVEEVMTFDAHAAQIVYSLLTVFGCSIDTTALALDAKGAYVQCELCSPAGTEREGLVLHWRHAVSHALAQHFGEPNLETLTWRRISPQLAPLAAARDKRTSTTAPVWRCGLCAWASRLSAPRRVIETHLRDVHEISPGLPSLVTDGYLYIQPTADSLLELAPPLTLYKMLETMASGTVSSDSEGNMLPAPTGSENSSIFFFCLRCPSHQRVKHYPTDESLQDHLRTEHFDDRLLLGETYTYLASHNI